MLLIGNQCALSRNVRKCTFRVCARSACVFFLSAHKVSSAPTASIKIFLIIDTFPKFLVIVVQTVISFDFFY